MSIRYVMRPIRISGLICLAVTLLWVGNSAWSQVPDMEPIAQPQSDEASAQETAVSSETPETQTIQLRSGQPIRIIQVNPGHGLQMVRPRIEGVAGDRLLLMNPDGTANWKVRLLSPLDADVSGAVVDYQPGEYMIGLELEAIEQDLLRQHLGIPEGQGLVVKRVFEESPAAQAGIQVGDILLEADGVALMNPGHLVQAVQAAAENPLSLVLIQSGERKTIEVTPVARESLLGSTLTVDDSGNLLLDNEQLLNQFLFSGGLPPSAEELKQMHLLVHPGRFPMGRSFADESSIEQITDSLHRLTEQLERLQNAIERLEERMESR